MSVSVAPISNGENRGKLIRRDDCEARKEELEELLLEGLKSGEPTVVTQEYREKKKAELLKRSKGKRRA